MEKQMITYRIEKEPHPWMPSKPWKVTTYINGQKWFSNNFRTKKLIYQQLEGSGAYEVRG